MAETVGQTAPPLPREAMLRACHAVAQTLDPINRARFPLAERDLQTVFLHDLQPEVEEWWELFGPEMYDNVAAATKLQPGDVWAVIAAALHLHRKLGAPIQVQTVTETAKLAAEHMKPRK